MNETLIPMDKETPATKDPSQANRVSQATIPVPFRMLQRPNAGQIERNLMANRIVYHIIHGDN